MRINHNITAMNTDRQLQIATGKAAKSMEKLSSGLRINRAADDAAGLSISEKMRNQIRGLDRASANSQDGISLIQTAEGALDETQAILKRMRELTVQAGNEGTLQQDDLEAIRDEFKELADELDGISERTEFNGKKLLDGSYEGVLQIGANQKQQLDLDVDVKTITAKDNVTLKGQDIVQGKEAGLNLVNLTDGYDITVGEGIRSIKFADATDEDDSLTAEIDGDGVLTITGRWDTSLATPAAKTDISIDDIKLAMASSDTTSNLYLNIKDISAEKDLKFAAADTITLAKAGAGATDPDVLEAGVKEVNAGGSTSSKDLGVSISKDKLEAGEKLDSALKAGIFFGFEGMDQVDVKTATDSNLERMDAANKAVSKVRSHLGANQNRLEHTIRNLDNAAENIQAAESRIRDVDMAKEMIINSKENILQQAATAMLAQANQAPQIVLRLLG